jgi:aspartate aminotransferase
MKRDLQWQVRPDQVVFSTGAKQSLINVLLAVLNPGDEVLLPAPYWVSYTGMIQMAEAKAVVLPSNAQSGYKISAQALEAAITPHTRMLLFSSPCNPSGSVMCREELEAWAVVLRKHPEILVVSDEIYEHIRFEGQHCSIVQCQGMASRTVVVNGMSKGFAMTGWRLGYAVAPPEVAAASVKLQGQFTSATCSIAQRAALAALNGPMDDTNRMCDAFRQRRDLAMAETANLPGWDCPVPDGAFYLFPNIAYWFAAHWQGQPIGNAERMAEFFLEEARVATVSGDAFGSPECIRLSIACSEAQIKEAIVRIRAALQHLHSQHPLGPRS